MSTAEFERITMDLEQAVTPTATVEATEMATQDLSVWFGKRKVLEGISIEFPKRSVTALIGPSGCGKSTFIRTLNRLHELIPGAALAVEVDAASSPSSVRATSERAGSRRVATVAAADLLAGIRVERERPAGYQRALFPHWQDVDGDGRERGGGIQQIGSYLAREPGERCGKIGRVLVPRCIDHDVERVPAMCRRCP